MSAGFSDVETATAHLLFYYDDIADNAQCHQRPIHLMPNDTYTRMMWNVPFEGTRVRTQPQPYENSVEPCVIQILSNSNTCFRIGETWILRGDHIRRQSQRRNRGEEIAMAPDWCYSSLCKSSSINTNPILLFSSFYHKPSFSCSSLPVSKRTQRRSASGTSLLSLWLVWFLVFFFSEKILFSQPICNVVRLTKPDFWVHVLDYLAGILRIEWCCYGLLR